MFWHFTAFSGGSCIIPRGLELAPFSLAATGAGTDKLLRLNSRAFTSCESRHTHLSHTRETHCTLGVMAGDIPKVNFFFRHLNWCGLRGLEFSFLSNIPPANPGLSWSPRSPAYSWLALPSSPEPHLSASHCHHDNPLEARQEVATWTSLWKAVWQSPSLTPSFLCSLLTAICCLFKALAAFWTVCIANSICLFSSLPPPPKGSTLFWAFSPLRPLPLRQRWWHRKSLYFCGVSDGFCSFTPACVCMCYSGKLYMFQFTH